MWAGLNTRRGTGSTPAKLGEEEWVIRSVGEDLVLTGGRPRGTLYAVYEFLERQVGCHWLDKDTEIIPSRPTLALGKLDIQAKPWFWKREVSSPTGCQDNKWIFMVRNKNYRYDFHGRKDFFPEGAFYRLEGAPRVGHSFSYFVNASDWFGTHPEYFSLDAAGQRVPAKSEAGPGQLCLSNPDVLRITKAKLREYIAKDRAEATQKGCPPPRVYMIGQNDRYDAHCKCAACQAIAKREGSESGPLIEFINGVAADIEKDYPDIAIETFAYNLTSPPPKTVKPRHNVLIGWCDVYSACDGIRPLIHPDNVRNYKEITGWGKVAPRLAIGDDYWTSQSYNPQFPTPYCMIQCIGPDLKLFADCHVESFFAEAHDYLEPGEHFTPLRFWLAYQLLVNPYQPAEPLIQLFLDGFYGAAAPAMGDYLAYLRKRMDNEAEFQILRNAPHKLKYLDLDFFVTAEKLFDAAEARVNAGSLESRHVRKERLILDGALLFLWPWLDRRLAPKEAMPFDHAALLRRYDEYWREHEKEYYSMFYSKESTQYSKEGRLREKVLSLLRDPKLPGQFRSLPPREVADFNWLTFSPFSPSAQTFVDDKEAAGEMAAKFTSVPGAIQAAEKVAAPLGGGDEVLARPLCFGVTGGVSITLKPEEIPQDGKYHLHKIGWINVKKGTTVWALEGKRLGVNVDRLFIPDAKDPAANDWVAYVSLKLKGPSYVKGAVGSNEALMDRVLLVRPQPGEQPDAAESLRRETQKRQDALRPDVLVPRRERGAAGDPLKVDWDKAVGAGKFHALKEAPTSRQIDARLAQDGDYLYVRLSEKTDAKRLVVDPQVFGGDDWELLFAARREKPYRQIGVNPKGKSAELAYGEGGWESGAKVVSEVGDGCWSVFLAFPLARLLPGGVRPGQAVFANILRGGKEPLVWSPIFTDGFHEPGRFGSVVLE